MCLIIYDLLRHSIVVQGPPGQAVRPDVLELPAQKVSQSSFLKVTNFKNGFLQGEAGVKGAKGEPASIYDEEGNLVFADVLKSKRFRGKKVTMLSILFRNFL